MSRVAEVLAGPGAEQGAQLEEAEAEVARGEGSQAAALRRLRRCLQKLLANAAAANAKVPAT